MYVGPSSPFPKYQETSTYSDDSSVQNGVNLVNREIVASMGEMADQYNEDHFGERMEEEEQAADEQAAEEAEMDQEDGHEDEGEDDVEDQGDDDAEDEEAGEEA
ncbi:hypothetical protein LTR56_027111 [Elasticomyces elasticus]|nr:hypothetical protein LTR56_027111 [Elasticomyces elasticus]KAK3616202.1 hypothetical protein LTR22_027153 [Elasticomyces elasticus]KAK4898559.1 hypothetical protein LTR49_027789 [Elasticomyces elasticus]KAK5734213.1 hypothetical protein LTS12_026753 [Elasticomyces elasticus]